MSIRTSGWAAVLGAALLPVMVVAGTLDTPSGTPAASIDLATREGVRLVQGTWRYSDTKIIETEFRAVGADLMPSGPPNRTYDFTPHAGMADFDASGWEVIDPTTLAARRGNGRLSFGWYRFAFTVPERIGDFDPTGATIAFEITVDDYAEVWVDGRLVRDLGQRGGSVVAGWNAPNRVTLARGARPGQNLRIAVFGINGPISDSPANYVWIRSARLDFYRPLAVPGALAGGGDILRADPGLDALVPAGAVIEKLADGFQFGEGPVWTRDGLLFSDPNVNVIYRWNEAQGVSVVRRRSGFDGADASAYHQPGSNGLALDPTGRLTIAQHGNRRITRIENDGKETVLADRYQGKRLNSPNDLVYRSDGTLFFTDPPFGLPRVYDDPTKELAFSGVYALGPRGELKLLTTEFKGPNGLAFSPDERWLYVGDWDEQRKVVRRYEVAKDGTLSKGAVFADLTRAEGAEAIDGVKVDARGDVYVSGPGGVWIFAPSGKHLGTIRGRELAANFAWGDADGRTLYLTARTGLYRVRLSVAGAPRIGVTAAEVH